MHQEQDKQNLRQLSIAFKSFMTSALEYARNYDRPEYKTLIDMIYMWAHPQGVTKLVRIITQDLQAKDIQPQEIDISQFLSLNQPDFPPQSQDQMENSLIIPKCPPPSKLSNKIEESEEKKEDSESQIQDEGQPDEFGVKRQKNQSQPSSISPSEDNRKYTRGPYKNYTTQEKMKAVKMYKEQKLTITEISKKLGIPCKNIKRWATGGVFRKIGGGRKRISPSLEEQVYNWVVNEYEVGESVSMDMIQIYALSQSTDPHFKASRGWVNKFIQRYKLRQNYKII